MNRKVVCGVYTRVSTDNQAEKEYNSCESQREKIDHFIKSQKDFSVFDYYSDEGFSGKDLERPAMQRMLQAVMAGKINCIVTYKIDRLTRSPKNFYQLIEVFEDYKVDFISVTERFDTSTPSGRLLRNIMLTFAQFERELSSERTRDKMYQRAEKGMWNGGFVPFGYRKENKELVIDEKEAEIVKKIYEVYIEKGSPGEVFQLLRDKKIRFRNWNVFSKSSIAHVLRNEVYLGKIKYGKKIYPGKHEAIISNEIFQEAQKRHNRAYTKVKRYREILFPGIVRCSECGSVMTTNYTTKNRNKRPKRYYYYRCTSTQKKGWNACSIKQVSMDRLEKFVLDTLRRVYHDEFYLRSLLPQIKEQYGASSSPEAGFSEAGDRVGLEKRVLCSEGATQNIRRSLQEIIKAAEKRTPGFCSEYMKNSFESIHYGKDVVKLRMFYRNDAGNGSDYPGQGRDESDVRPRKRLEDNVLQTDGADSMSDVPGRPDGNRDASGQPRGGAMSLAAERLREAERGEHIYPVFSTKKRTGQIVSDLSDSTLVAQKWHNSPVYEVCFYNDISKSRTF